MRWHQKLGREHIDELKEEGLRPGDEEYYEYLWNHNININKDRETRYPSEYKRIGWEIDELRKEGYNAKQIIISPNLNIERDSGSR